MRVEYKRGDLRRSAKQHRQVGTQWHWLQLDAAKRRFKEERSSSKYMVLVETVGLPALISVECDGTKGQRFHSEPLLPLQQIPSSKSNLNLGTESDDEVDEIGALIYDQVMRNKGKSN